MAWSTREIAELAGTSLRSVRHYHQVGLLPEPERRSNGYKQYGVAHLVRLLRIKRLADLGFSLEQIADLGDGDEHPAEALRELDVELETRIDRLQTLRAELAEMIERKVPTDLPAEFAAVRDVMLTPADRAAAAVLGRLLAQGDRATYVKLLSDEARKPSDDAFDALPPDADEAARQELAERMAADYRHLTAEFPELPTLGERSPRGPAYFGRTIGAALADVYHPAQLDVLGRLNALITRSRTD